MRIQALLWSSLTLLASLPSGLAAKSFAGSNLYYAAGLADNKNPLPSNVQQARDVLLGGLQSAGVKVLRVWLDGQTTSNSKNTPIVNFPGLEDSGPGQWDDTVLERLDDFMMEAIKYGIKLHVSVMSYASLGGNWYGSGGSDNHFNDFYTNEDKKSAFKRRIAHVLQHVNRHTNKAWSQSSDHIFAFEAQNEAFNNEANPSAAKKQWQCDMAKAIKDGMNGAKDILVSTGGSGYFDVSVFDEYFQCPSIDIVAVHAYGGDLEQGHLSRAVTKAQQNGKFVVIQEWGACYDNGPNEQCSAANGVQDNASRNQYISDHAGVMNQAGVPWMYWQILPNEWKSGDWNYELAINGPNWGTFKSAALAADASDSPFDFSRWLPGGGGGTNPPPSTTTSSAGTGPTSSPGNGFPHNTCKWGCEGWSCSSSSPCQSAYSCTGGYCKNCTWGCGGWNCSANQPCNADYSCVNGVCHHDGPATGN